MGLPHLYSYGYQGTVLTEAQLNTKATWIYLHPEMRRRALAMFNHMLDRGVQIGIGTGWRVQPVNKPGFAPPGNSWHESVPVSPRTPTALAIDVVPAAAWKHMEPILADFHLRSFRNVNSEPWHIQPIEIPAGRRYATTLPPLNTPILPGETPTTPPEEETDMRVLRLRLRVAGQLYDDQVYAVTLGNAETLKKLGIEDNPMFEANLDATRAEVEAELGFPLTPAD